MNKSFPENLYSIIVISNKRVDNILWGFILKPFFPDNFHLRVVDNIKVFFSFKLDNNNISLYESLKQQTFCLNWLKLPLTLFELDIVRTCWNAFLAISFSSLLALGLNQGRRRLELKGYVLKRKINWGCFSDNEERCFALTLNIFHIEDIS